MLDAHEQKHLGVISPKLESNDFYTEKHDCVDELAPLKSKIEYEKEHLPHVLGTGVPDNLEAIKFDAIIEDNADKDLTTTMKTERPIAEKPTERRVPEPIVPAYSNFLTARKMAQENLEHQPLPDAIMDFAFRKLQAQGAINPGLALEVIPIATGNFFFFW